MEPITIIAAAAAAGVALWKVTRSAPADEQEQDSPATPDSPVTPVTDNRVQKIAAAFARAEGYYRADGTINVGAKPVRNNNPGDITDRGVVATYATVEEGWQALYHQIAIILDGTSRRYTPTMPLTQVASIYTSASGVELINWTQVVASELGIAVTDSLSQVT